MSGYICRIDIMYGRLPYVYRGALPLKTLVLYIYRPRGTMQYNQQLYAIYSSYTCIASTLEAFLQSVASESQLKMLNDFAVLSSVVYVLIKVLLTRYAGAVGLIISDAIRILSQFMVFLFRLHACVVF
jgi:hypothetical protein